VVDDFAHHPTAVALTLDGARHRFPGRRLVVAFEPRSLTAGRTMFFAAYVEAFARADLALIAPVYHRGRLAADEVLDRDALVAALRTRGCDAAAIAEGADPVAAVRARLRAGDVVITMSSGDFGGLPRRLAAALAETR
jgi:UDP-N-acetylmuramate: L-alanyl-gamma-D-glutamyl-meso-diaminopimelate ligase